MPESGVVTDYEYIYFSRLPASRARKTSIWECINVNSETVIGEVRWYGRWRQYCFMPAAGTVFSAGCLADIRDFIEKLMSERRG